MANEFSALNGVPAQLPDVKLRKAHVKRIIVQHPMYRTLLQRIADYHEMSRGTNLNDGIFISGDTGMGKTTLLKEYTDRYPQHVGDVNTTIPVVYVRVPVGSTVKTLASKILESLGDPLFDRGTEMNMLSRIYHYLKVCEVEMIIFDEFQHLIDSDTQHVLTKVSNWIKTFIETIERPVILCGMPESINIFAHNSQLDRRFCHRFELTAFKYGTPQEQKNFRSFLFNIDKLLPFAEKSHLADIAFAERLYYVSLGVPFYIMKTIEEATEYAVRNGEDRLTMNALHEAFNSISLSKRPHLVNPFHDDFNFLKAIAMEEKLSRKSSQERGKRR